MPCCCASNIKAAFVIGIILTVLYALEFGYNIIMSFSKGITFESTFEMTIGFLGLVSASILAFGAHTRNRKAMLIYIGLAIIIIILSIVGAVLGILKFFRTVGLKNKCPPPYDIYQACLNAGTGSIIAVVLISVGVIVFDFWTIFVAKNAKKEIEVEQ
jgi:hypothetical protein